MYQHQQFQMVAMSLRTPLKFHIRYGLLILSILLAWGVREAHKIAPQAKQAFQQVTRAEKIDIKIGGCIPIKGTI